MTKQTIKIGDRVVLEDGSIGFILNMQPTENTTYPFVYEVETTDIVHVTNSVKPLRRKRDLATLIGITHNQ